MSKYLPSIKESLEFEGDTVTFDVRSMDREDFMPLSAKIELAEDGTTVKMAFKDQMEFAAMAAELLPKYIDNFTGLKDAAGAPVDLQTVCSKLYFMSLAQGLVTVLFKHSRLDTNDTAEGPSEEKKSGEQSGPG